MKLKTLITLLFIAAAVSFATAQKAKHFEIGFQGGYGSSWIVNQNNYGLQEMDYDFHYGGSWNFQAGYNFNNNIGLFTEVGMSNLGQSYTDTWDKQNVERSVHLNYLNVPVFFKYSYGESRARFRLMVGPQFSFLQKAEQEYTLDGSELNPANPKFTPKDKEGNEFYVGEKDITDRYNSMDVAFVLDLGADIFLMENILYLSAAARVYYGFMDLNAAPYQMENYDGNYDPSHNAGGMILLGLHYIIAGKADE
ncbi:MAG TPA: porin family protein [Bacteroidales bacterium]|nr:porin family protein [Bacteroidales bacterium]